MATGFPVKANYATGDVLTAANMNDLAGTLNQMDPTAKGDLFPASDASTLTRLAVGADYGFLQALASESTGLKWDSGAWTSYTPTITAGTGTFTSVNGSGLYKRIGKLCAVKIQVNIVTNGTAATLVYTTLPFNATTGSSQGVFREGAVTGNCGIIESSGSTASWRTFTNGYPGGTGYTLNGSIVYEVA